MSNFASRPQWGRLILLVVALGLVASCGKKESVKHTAGPALWRVSDTDSDVYLFGSFHLLPQDLAWQRPELKAAFARSVLLVLETDTRAENPGELTALVEKYAIAPKDKPLRGRMTPEQRTGFEELATSLGVDPARLDPFEPWYAGTILTVQYAQKKGLVAEKGVEATLIGLAGAEKKPLAFLETLEEQIRFLAELPEETQLKMLTATLGELKSADAEMDAMQKAWASGDTASMAKLFDKSIRDVPELHAVLITERNKRWAGEIAKLMAGAGTVFIAVGAGHLVGDDSVIALLRERGLKVEGP
jgi:hypothetical protein